MTTAFISSVQRDFGDVREAAARAAEAFGLRVLMAERAAAGGPPRRALLDLVRNSDVFILILGARYGEAAEGGTSPTEDEFNEAVRLGLPVLVFVQICDRDTRQTEFLQRVRGAWAEGNLTTDFAGPEDIGMQVMTALRRLEQQAAGGTARPRAEERAAELARGQTHGGFSGGSSARVAYAPLIEGRFLDDIALNANSIGEQGSAMMRSVGLVSQRHGIDSQVSGATGIRLVATTPTAANGQDTVQVDIGLDGAIVVQAPVAGTGNFGSSLRTYLGRGLWWGGEAFRCHPTGGGSWVLCAAMMGGGSRIGCGSGWSRCFRRGRCIRWGVTTRGCRIVMR